jgi:hypothetical protein
MSKPALPAHKIYHPIGTIDDLLIHLQWAMSVEASTVPPYLTAQWSMTDTSSVGYAVVRSVVIEEMLHMNLVANLMNAIGGAPSLAREDVPEYPGFLKHHAAGGPFVQLQPMSTALASTVFMAIERPEVSPHAPAEGGAFATIGQFYKAIEEGFERCVARYGERAVFDRDTGCQRADLYFGSGGGRPVLVHDLASAQLAIREITQQGEGAPAARPPLPGEERFGSYEHYGQRLDGTYGPILGVPWEMSHYRKFAQLADGTTALPSVYPMQTNPSLPGLDEPVRRLAELFDGAYTVLLAALQRTFTTTRPAAFFGLAVPVMRSVPGPVATLLMQTPIDLNADPTLGPTAGPGFRYRTVSLADLLDEARALRTDAPQLGAAYIAQWRQTLDAVLATIGGAQDFATELDPAAVTRSGEAS